METMSTEKVNEAGGDSEKKNGWRDNRNDGEINNNGEEQKAKQLGGWKDKRIDNQKDWDEETTG